MTAAPKHAAEYGTRARRALLVRRVGHYLRTHPNKLELVKIPDRKINGKVEKVRGYYFPTTEGIHLDYTDAIIPTILHECMHHYHPEWDEARVVREESIVVATLSKADAIKLVELIAKYVKKPKKVKRK